MMMFYPQSGWKDDSGTIYTNALVPQYPEPILIKVQQDITTDIDPIGLEAFVDIEQNIFK